VGGPAVTFPDPADVEAARRAISPYALRTPLVRLDPLGAAPSRGVDRSPGGPGEPGIYLKLENLQPIGAFKIRGAAAVLGQTPRELLAQGVLTASAGNMAQGVAWLAREQGLPCTVIAPESAPEVKLAAIEALGATVVRVGFEAWWQAFEERAYPGVEGTFVHAFDDLRVMAGNATIAAEILEDLPGVDAVITPWGGRRPHLRCRRRAGMAQALLPGVRV
jgi:threonine dehydratase